MHDPKFTYGSRANYSSAVENLFQDAQGLDILHRSVGLKPIETRPMVGAFRPETTIDPSMEHAPMIPAPIENQPGYAKGAEVPVIRRKAAVTETNPEGYDIPEDIKTKVNATEAVRGAMTAQLGSPWNIQVPDEKGISIHFPAEGKSNPTAMKKAFELTEGKGAIVDIGAGRNFLNFGKQALTKQEINQLHQLVGETKLEPGEVAPPPINTTNISDYVNYANEWARQPGSGAVTRKMFQYLDALGDSSPGALRKLDSEVQTIAGRLYNLYKLKAANLAGYKMPEGPLTAASGGAGGGGGQPPIRLDLMNMLDVLSKKGLTGLRQELNSGGFLPAIALLILGGGAGAARKKREVD
jgi:hypothetical protein